MLICILTFPGFNELDSFMASAILNRVKTPDWRVRVCCQEQTATSMNGLTVQAQSGLGEASRADAVVVGSGGRTRDIVNDPEIMDRLKLDPARQLIAAQCSGTLVLAKLGPLGRMPACTDLTTRPWVQEAGVRVLDQPFHAAGNVATAGGCLSSAYLAAWIIAKTQGIEAACQAIHYVAPVGEKDDYLRLVRKNIEPFI